ncbi:MAG: hypothetical protein H0Z38_09700, partial [Firmicutes bacterium]|nr:hypothetical protein [Bacillota bacterium]
MTEETKNTRELIDQLEDAMADDDSTSGEDGSVRVTVKDDGVYIIVTPPKNGGTPADWLAAQVALDAKEIVDYDISKVRDALAEMSGTPVWVAERKPELDRDAEVSVVVEDEGMSAYL